MGIGIKIPLVFISLILLLILIPTSAEAKTYYIYVAGLPEHWKNDFGHVLPEAKQYWKDRILGTNFVEITSREKADFGIQWASQYQGGKLGYWNPSSVNEFGIPYIAITLGYMDDESVKWQDRKFNLVDPEYATLITTHEIGHAIGFEHSTDPNDIMFPSITNYDSWLSNKNKSQEGEIKKSLSPILQDLVSNMIEGLKPQIYLMQDALYAAEFSNLDAQKEKDNAWNSFGLAKAYFDDAESAQKKGEGAISESNHYMASQEFDYSISELIKIQDPLEQAKAHLDKGQQLESEYQEKTKEEPSNQTEERETFCFLFWCFYI